MLIKPYGTAEAGNNRRKRLFNSRLSGLRTVMSENQFGVWKRRFPILKGLRTHFELSQKIVVATAILFNFGRMLNDDPPEDDDEEESDDDRDTEKFRNVRIEGDGNTIRLRGTNCGTTCVSDYLMCLFWLIYIYFGSCLQIIFLYIGGMGPKKILGKILVAAVR